MSEPEPPSAPALPNTPQPRNAARRALQRLVRGNGRPAVGGPRANPFGVGRDPVPLSDSVSDFIAERGWEQVTATASVTAQWAQIVGDDVAAHASPESVLDGVLTIRADSTAWATQIRLLLPQVRQAIDRAVGPGVIADIRIAGPQGPTWKAGPRRVKGRGPRDTYG